MRSDWIFDRPMAAADYPPEASEMPGPYRVSSCARSPYRSEGDSRVWSPYTTPWPDSYGVTLDDQIGVELGEIGGQILERSLIAGDGDIGVRRSRYRCYECYAGYLASRYRRLPWTFTVSLSAPEGCFEDWWAQAQILSGFVPAGPAQSVSDLLSAPFWIGVFAWQPSTATVPEFLPVQGEIHVHLVVGNVNRVQLDSILARWPEQGRFVKVKAVYHAWGALHYCLSQTRIARREKGESEASYWNRVKSDHMYKRDALATAPFGLDTLDLWEIIIMLRQTVKRSRPKTPESVARARILAGEHWPIWWIPDGVIHRLPLALDQDQRKVVKFAILLHTVGATR